MDRIYVRYRCTEQDGGVTHSREGMPPPRRVDMGLGYQGRHGLLEEDGGIGATNPLSPSCVFPAWHCWC